MEFIAHGAKALYLESRNPQRKKQDKHYLAKSVRMRTSGGLKLGKLIKKYWKKFNNDKDLIQFKIIFITILAIGFSIYDGGMV